MKLDQLARRAARRAPEAIAVTAPDGTLTYGELASASSSVATELQARGVHCGDRVVIYGPKSLDFVVSMQACLTIGAAYIPIDEATPPERARVIATDCGATLAIVARTTIGRLIGVVAEIPSTTMARTASHSGGAGAPNVGPDSLAYILYTSGSTGKPKGVCITHRNAIAFVQWAVEELRLAPEDRLANHAPLSFDLSVLDLYGAFAAGASVHLVPGKLAYSPLALTDFLYEQDITIWYSVPSALVLMIREGDLLQRAAPARLRAILVAGEPCPIDTLRSLSRWSPARLLNLYGPTETNVCTFRSVTGGDLKRDMPPPIGKECSGDSVRVLRPDGAVAGPRQEGELVVDGPTVMHGYWGQPPHRGAYHTGDLVRVLPDGALDYVGRIDQMVKIRGHRVELAEVEAVISAHPLVDQAVAAVRGTGVDARLTAYVVTADDQMPSLLELKAYCARHLPRYMLPDEVHRLTAIPRTPNGKINRKKLANRGGKQ